MKIYILTAYNLELQFFNEHLVFTSLAKAEASKSALMEYLVRNHDLSPNLDYMGNGTTYVDGAFNVSIISHDVSKNVASYT